MLRGGTQGNMWVHCASAEGTLWNLWNLWNTVEGSGNQQLLVRPQPSATTLLLFLLNSLEKDDCLLLFAFLTPVHIAQVNTGTIYGGDLKGWESSKSLDNHPHWNLPSFCIISFNCWSSSSSLQWQRERQRLLHLTCHLAYYNIPMLLFFHEA